LPAGFGVIWTTVALDLIGFGIILPVLPRFAEDAGASPTVAGVLVASFSVAQLVFAPVWGRVSDRIGRKPVLIVSLVGTAVGSLLTGLAGASLAVLFLGRIVDGGSSTAPRGRASPSRRHRSPISRLPSSAPGCSDCSAPRSARGSRSGPRSAASPRSSTAASRSSSPPWSQR
jgi:MFS family permease